MELCLVLLAEVNSLSEIGFCFTEINLITKFQAATFRYLLFQQVANGIFRWQLCYLLLLISNPGVKGNNSN